MDFESLPTEDEALSGESQPLISTMMLKSMSSSDDEVWKFSGIASDEEVDTDGDTILRKTIDLTYAQKKGYVNWDHRRDPEYQLGFLTKAVIIGKKNAEELRKSGFPDLPDSASVYMEGQFYKGSAKAVEVFNILKSTPEGSSGLGLSLDGAVARDTKNGGIVKAYVRGVAITAAPAQPRTLVKLSKSIQAYNRLEGLMAPADLPKAIAGEVVELLKSVTEEPSGMTHDEAVLWVLKKKPNWSYDLAKKVVDFTVSQKQRS